MERGCSPPTRGLVCYALLNSPEHVFSLLVKTVHFVRFWCAKCASNTNIGLWSRVTYNIKDVNIIAEEPVAEVEDGRLTSISMSELFFIELETIKYFYFVFERLTDCTKLWWHLVNVSSLQW